MIFQHWPTIPTVDLETHWSGMSQFFLWKGGKGSRMVSFMYQSAIKHLWLMDSFSEGVEVVLYTQGQIRSNKGPNNVAEKKQFNDFSWYCSISLQYRRLIWKHIDLECLNLLWGGGKGSRMVSFMCHSAIQHLWPMDAISERIDVLLYRDGQWRSNKALTTLQRNTTI